MSAAVLFQRHRRKRKPAPAAKTCPVKPQEDTQEQLTESASWQAWVLIPDAGKVIELPVLETYESKGVTYNANGVGGRVLPIYSVLANREVLQRHFAWLGREINRLGQEDLADEAEMSSVQKRVFERGNFGFWVIKNKTGYFYGNSTVHKLFLKDVPTGELRRLQQVFLTAATGLPVKEVPVTEFAGVNELTLADAVNSGRHMTPHEIAHALEEPGDLEGVNPKQLADLLDWPAVNSAFGQLSGDAQIRFTDSVVTALKYSLDNGVNVDVTKYQPAIAEALRRSISESLQEASFSRLLGLTQANGGYRYGGMRKVEGRWVIDPSVSGRIDNSRFIVVSMPSWRLGQDGFPVMNYVCKSAPERSTTGMRQVGFIKVTNQGGFLRKLAGKFLPQIRSAEPDVQCFCSCPDWKYRFHWVMSQMGAAATPTGAGGQATNAPPNKTNPSFRPSLCKHLAACDQFIDFSNADFRKLIRKVGTAPVQTTQPRRDPVIRRNTQVTASPTPPKGGAPETPEDKGVTPPEAASASPRLA